MAAKEINREDLNKAFEFLDNLKRFSLERSTSKTVSRKDALVLLKKHIAKLCGKGYSAHAIYNLLKDPQNNIPVQMKLSEVQAIVDDYQTKKAELLAKRQKNKALKSAEAESALTELKADTAGGSLPSTSDTLE